MTATAAPRSRRRFRRRRERYLTRRDSRLPAVKNRLFLLTPLQPDRGGCEQYAGIPQGLGHTLLVFLVLRKQFVRGLTLGSTKG